MHESVPTYEELKHRLAKSEVSLHALRHGQMETMTAEHRSLMTRLAEARSKHFKLMCNLLFCKRYSLSLLSWQYQSRLQCCRVTRLERSMLPHSPQTPRGSSP